MEHSALGNGVGYWRWMLLDGPQGCESKPARTYIPPMYTKLNPGMDTHNNTLHNTIQITSTCWDGSMRIVFIYQCQHEVMFRTLTLFLEMESFSLSVWGCLASVPFHAVYFCCRPATLTTTETKSSASLRNPQRHIIAESIQSRGSFTRVGTPRPTQYAPLRSAMNQKSILRT